jgi:hypothetical protein
MSLLACRRPYASRGSVRAARPPPVAFAPQTPAPDLAMLAQATPHLEPSAGPNRCASPSLSVKPADESPLSTRARSSSPWSSKRYAIAYAGISRLSVDFDFRDLVQLS